MGAPGLSAWRRPTHSSCGVCAGAHVRRGACFWVRVHARGASVPARAAASACMCAVQWLSNGASAGGCAFVACVARRLLVAFWSYVKRSAAAQVACYLASTSAKERALFRLVRRPTHTHTRLQAEASTRAQASIRPPTHAPTRPKPHEYARTPASSERRGSPPLGRRDKCAVYECAPVRSGTAKQQPRQERPTRTDALRHTHTHTPCSMEVRRRWPATQPQRTRARPSSKDSATTFLRT